MKCLTNWFAGMLQQEYKQLKAEVQAIRKKQMVQQVDIDNLVQKLTKDDMLIKDVVPAINKLIGTVNAQSNEIKALQKANPDLDLSKLQSISEQMDTDAQALSDAANPPVVPSVDPNPTFAPTTGGAAPTSDSAAIATDNTTV